MTPGDKLSFTTEEVAELTGLKIKTLENWRFENRGPRFVKLGRCVRYPAQALRRWLDNNIAGGDPMDPPLAAA